jgi:hypothetical protein
MATARVYHARLELAGIRLTSRFVNRVLNEIEREAKLIAVGGPYSKGRLAQSIYNTGARRRGLLVTGQVGSRLSYAAAVEGGAKIHDIFPKGAPHMYRFGAPQRPMLKFFWRKAGRVVYMHQIPGGPTTIGRSHPGQKGKGFLRIPLLGAAIRHRMRVIVYDI